MKNTGGRQEFQRGTEVCVLTLEGQISKETYFIEPPNDIESTKDTVRADRKGHVTLQESGTKREIKVHYRRILDLEIHGKAVVMESGDKYRACCPKCVKVFKIEPSHDTITCPLDGIFELHWIGERPVTDTTTVETDPKVAAKPTTAKPKREKKPVREPIKVDFVALKATPNCEVWTKKNVAFDHPGVDVKSHVLLFTGTPTRKLCFNSYDGTLGKKGTALPIDDFVSGKTVKGGFNVKDIDKERTALTNKSYEVV